MNEYIRKYHQQVKDMVEVCHRDAELGYGPAVSGNVSLRVDEDVVLVTPTQTPKRIIEADDICVLTLQGDSIYIPEGKKPTGEIFMHLHILKMRPDVLSVIHAHPPLATGLTTCEDGKDALMLPLIPEAMMQLGPVITVPYADPNMQELGLAFNPMINDSNCFMLESHGAVVCSPEGVLHAIELLQTLESLALSINVGRLMGDRLKSLNERDTAGIDEVIRELGWSLPGAPGRYANLVDMFFRK